MFYFLQVPLGSVLAAGPLLFFITIILHYNYIVSDCKVETAATNSTIFVEGSYAVIHLLMITSLFAFIFYVRRAWQHIQYKWFINKLNIRCPDCNSPSNIIRCLLSWLIIFTFFIMAVLPVGMTITGALRDDHYITAPNYCNSTSKFGREALNVIHSVFKGTVLTEITVVSFIAMHIFYAFEETWDPGHMYAEIDEITEEEDLNSVIEKAEKSFLKLYNSYLVQGKKIIIGCNAALKNWFAIVCLVYFLLTLTTLIQTVKAVEENLTEYYLDIIHSVILLLHYFSAFFGLYFMGTRLNALHQKYYSEMVDRYWTYQIVVKLDQTDMQSDGTITFVCKPGDEIKCTKEILKAPNETSGLTTTIVLKDDDSEERYREKAKNKHEKVIYHAAANATLVKVDEFDFIPTIFNTTIPLDSQGYIFAILLTMTSVVFSIA